MQERVIGELQERYGTTDKDELRGKIREEIEAKAAEKLAEEDGVDVAAVGNAMEEMSRRNRELFAVPPYVLDASLTTRFLVVVQRHPNP
jgi:hypothetical protein